MKFLAKLQNMAASEIMNVIPSEIYHEIKEKDPNPVFRAYVIGHEGEATGKQVGGWQVVKNWFSSAIRKIVDKLQFGTKLFHGHNLDSSHEGRQPIGEIVGKALKKVENKLSAIGIAYIYPEYRGMPLDVASIEANINISPSKDSVEAIDVKDITGIALGNSAIEKPGFANATLLSQIQAFAYSRSQQQFNKGGDTMPTLSEIRKFVSDEGISPNEIFGRDALIDDPVVKGYTKERIKEEVAGEYAGRKRKEEALQKSKEEWEKEKKELEEEIKKLQSESAKVKAADLFNTKAKERKLDDRQIRFIENKKESFAPKDPDKLEKEVDEFMDSVLEEYKSTAEIFGVKEEDKAESKGGSEPGSDTGSSDDNELIPD